MRSLESERPTPATGSTDELGLSVVVEVLAWNQHFETGFAEIDHQHRELCDLINELARHLVQRADARLVADVFQRVSAYAALHFKTEEAVWQRYFGQDGWAQAHHGTHTGFLRSMHSLMAEDRNKPSDGVLLDFVGFLAHWMVVHILDEDKRMAIAAQAIGRGSSIEAAKALADREMIGATRVLVDTLLSIYESLTARTLQLHVEITQRKRIEARLRLASHVLEHTLDAICILDAGRRVEEANPAFCRACGLEAAEIAGRHVAELMPDLAKHPEAWAQARGQQHWCGEISDRDPDGALRVRWLTLSWLEHGDAGEATAGHYVAVFSNVDALLRHRHELERLATQDALTGLPNRLALLDRLPLALAHAERSGRRLAVCFLDLDGFKAVNDSFGHDAGDLLLKETAQRIRQVLRGEDTIARLGGDEFVLLLGDLDAAEACRTSLAKVMTELQRPFDLPGGHAQVSASIGVALCPDDARETEALLTLADHAMYQSKKAGKARISFHTAP